MLSLGTHGSVFFLVSTYPLSRKSESRMLWNTYIVWFLIISRLAISHITINTRTPFTWSVMTNPRRAKCVVLVNCARIYVFACSSYTLTFVSKECLSCIWLQNHIPCLCNLIVWLVFTFLYHYYHMT